MPKPTSNEKRADIIKHMEAGESRRDIAKWLFVSEDNVAMIWKNIRLIALFPSVHRVWGWWAIRDPNPGPTGYEPVALTN